MTLKQWFSTFICLRHPSFVIEQFGGTPSFNLLEDISQVYLFTAPRGSAEPRLKITPLKDQKFNSG